jgi:uncharacterized lipoprotein YmbA
VADRRVTDHWIADHRVCGQRWRTCEIIDLSIPQYLEKFQIASRRASNELSLSDGHQWGENLRKNLTRTMAQNLSRLLGTVDVGTPINRSLSAPDYRVRIYIEQFERGDDGRVRLSARWQVTGSADDHALEPEALELVSNRAAANNDYGDTVKLMRRLFGRLSERIAESIVTHEADHLEKSGD